MIVGGFRQCAMHCVCMSDMHETTAGALQPRCHRAEVPGLVREGALEDAPTLGTLLLILLKVLVHDGDGEQDTRAGADRAKGRWGCSC